MGAKLPQANQKRGVGHSMRLTVDKSIRMIGPVWHSDDCSTWPAAMPADRQRQVRHSLLTKFERSSAMLSLRSWPISHHAWRSMASLFRRLQQINDQTRAMIGWLMLRLTLAGLIGAHGWARLLSGGVRPFGDFLESQGFPIGLQLAASVTAIEIIGSVLLALGRLVVPLNLLLSGIYLLGILLVHAKVGWFVVGLGRNGSEYSVLLIVCLWAVALQHLKRRS